MKFTPKDCELLAKQLKLPMFDLLLVADGSGSLSHTPSGWYCCCYYKPSGKVTEHYGGASGGTNNYAELMPFIHTLWAFNSAWYTHFNKKPNLKVVCVTDSEISVDIGNGASTPISNRALWASIEWFRGHGYHIDWHHVPRNSNLINKRADYIAGKVRKTIRDFANAKLSGNTPSR